MKTLRTLTLSLFIIGACIFDQAEAQSQLLTQNNITSQSDLNECELQRLRDPYTPCTINAIKSQTIKKTSVEKKRLLRARKSRSSARYSSGSRRSRSSRARVSRGSRRSIKIRIKSRSSYYRGGTSVIRFSKPSASLCYTNTDCRSRCCRKNYVRKVQLKGKLVFNRYYGKKTKVVRYKKTYKGTATVRYVNGRKIKRWNVRDRICQASRRFCPPGRLRVYASGGDVEGGSGGIIGAIVVIICCCCFCFCCIWSIRNRVEEVHEAVVIIEDHGDVHIDDYSHHSGGHDGGDYGGSHHDDDGGDYGDDGGHDDGGGDDGGGDDGY